MDDTDILDHNDYLLTKFLQLHKQKDKGEKIPDRFAVMYWKDIFIFNSDCTKHTVNYLDGMETEHTYDLLMIEP